jgi:protein ImuA
MKPLGKEELKALKAQILRIERPQARLAGALATGCAEIDDVLPEGGLAKAAVHELTGSAAGGFAAMLAGRSEKPVLWCVADGAAAELYGPGLAAFGVAAERLVIARCRSADDMLWAMEEGLREPALGLVIGEPSQRVSLTASRRLQLAAEAGGGLGIILCRGHADSNSAGALAPSAVASRWQVDSAPALSSLGPLGPLGHGAAARWQLRLLRCRGGDINFWGVEWDDAAHTLALAADAGRGGLGTAAAHG